ncbi:MAG: DUF4256 domain-containing protein [Candidatus Kariarchaeaceae archaeon]
MSDKPDASEICGRIAELKWQLSIHFSVSSKKPSKKIEKLPMIYKKTLSESDREELITSLETRFAANTVLHQGITWDDVRARLEKSDRLWSIMAMEDSGGEPDIVGYDSATGEFAVFDCSPETPERKHICYDPEGLARREKKGVFPAGSALGLAEAMGIELLTEEDYRYLQSLAPFDQKTSSWLSTPDAIRDKGGAIFGDRRYDHVFIYHNGADSFYGARGFRGKVRI